MDLHSGLKKQEKILFVDRRPTANTFYSSLAEYEIKSKEMPPSERLRAEIKQLERFAARGDLKAWQEKYPLVLKQAETLAQDPLKDLETRVHLKKLELMLLLAARKRAQLQVKILEQKAADAQANRWVKQHEVMEKQAEKLRQLAKNLEEQILAKTA